MSTSISEHMAISYASDKKDPNFKNIIFKIIV